MPGVIHSPVAWTVPFESEPERSNGFVSDNVQEAIEEALALAVSNDRFLVLPQYNGNANPGRLLEFFNGIDSAAAPLFFNKTAKVLSITARTTAVDSTCTIGFYNKTVDPSFLTPLYTLTMTAQQIKTVIGTALIPIFSLPALGRLVVKVDTGSINKPHLQLTFSSAL